MGSTNVKQLSDGCYGMCSPKTHEGQGETNMHYGSPDHSAHGGRLKKATHGRWAGLRKKRYIRLQRGPPITRGWKNDSTAVPEPQENMVNEYGSGAGPLGKQGMDRSNASTHEGKAGAKAGERQGGG